MTLSWTWSETSNRGSKIKIVGISCYKIKIVKNNVGISISMSSSPKVAMARCPRSFIKNWWEKNNNNSLTNFLIFLLVIVLTFGVEMCSKHIKKAHSCNIYWAKIYSSIITTLHIIYSHRTLIEEDNNKQDKITSSCCIDEISHTVLIITKLQSHRSMWLL